MYLTSEKVVPEGVAKILAWSTVIISCFCQLLSWQGRSAKWSKPPKKVNWHWQRQSAEKSWLRIMFLMTYSFRWKLIGHKSLLSIRQWPLAAQTRGLWTCHEKGRHITVKPFGPSTCLTFPCSPAVSLYVKVATE